MVKPIVCSGLKRSASTWSYHVCRQLLARTIDPKKALLSAGYVEDTDASLRAFSERRAQRRRPEVAVLKSHEIGPLTMAAIARGKVRNVYTLRDPRDALASLVRFWPPRKEEPFEAYIRNFQRWLIQGEAMMRSAATLVVRYEDMVADPCSQIEAIARHLKLPARAPLIEAVDAETSSERMQERVAHIEEQATFAEAAFDPDSQLHRRHLDSGEVGRWRHEFSAQQRRQAIIAFLPWLVGMGYAEGDLLERLDGLG